MEELACEGVSGGDGEGVGFILEDVNIELRLSIASARIPHVLAGKSRQGSNNISIIPLSKSSACYFICEIRHPNLYHRPLVLISMPSSYHKTIKRLLVANR